MSLHPEYKTMLEQFYAMKLPDYSELSATDARIFMAKILSERIAPEIVLAEVCDRAIEVATHVIPARVYYPSKSEKLPAIVYFHGGGFVLGNLEQWEYPCSRLAKESGMVVISVDYRLAPEHVFPAALDDAYDALCWVADNASELGVDVDRIVVAGDSAGGNLAAAISLMARDRSGPKIAMQWLLYPWLDDNFTTQSYNDYGDGYLLSTESMRWFYDHYWPNKQDCLGAYALPLKSDNLVDLPPTYIITAECDPLRDEGEVYAEKLKMAGNNVVQERMQGMIHGFFMHFTTKAANDAVLRMIARFKQVFQSVVGGVDEA